MMWACFDWSQIEYRLIVNDAAHFGMRGADAVVDIYNNDPQHADFHQIVADMTGLPREQSQGDQFWAGLR